MKINKVDWEIIMSSFKSRMKKIAFVRWAYDRLIYFKKLFMSRKESVVFMENGEKVIEVFNDSLKKTGLMYFVDAGTLIGIYRDGKLLRRDMDIDTGVIANNQAEIYEVRSVLKDAGFVLKEEFLIPENVIIQDTFDYMNVRVDVSYFNNNDNGTTCYILYGKRILKMSYSRINETKEYPFNNQSVRIPIDTDRYLAERYGENWRKPDPFFKYWEGPSVTIMEGEGNSNEVF